MNYLNVVILIDDDELQRLVATWPRLTDEQRKNDDEIADASKISRARVAIILKRARVHQMIADDGSISQDAVTFLQSIVAEKMAERSRKMTAAQKKKKDDHDDRR